MMLQATMAELKSVPPTGEWHPPSKSQRRAWRRLRLASCRQVVVDFSWLGLDVINYSAGIKECEKGEVKLEPYTRHGKGNSVCEKREAKIEPDAISYIAGTRTCEKGEAKLEPDIISISTGISECEKARAKPDVINYRTCEKGEAKAKLEPDIISISTGNSEREKVITRAEHNAISCSTEIGVSVKGQQAKLGPDSISISAARTEPKVSTYNAEISVSEKGQAKLERDCEKREAKLEPTLSSPSHSSSHLVATAGSENTDIISYRVGTRECEKGEAKLEPIDISTGNSVYEKVVARAESNAISCSAEASVCQKGQAMLEPDDIINFSAGNSGCEKGNADVESRACEKGQAKLEPDIISINTGNSACDKQAARAEPYASSYKAEISVCEKGQAKLEPECEKREAKLEPTIYNPSYSSHLVAMAGSENTSRAMCRISACEKGKAWQDERARLLRDADFLRPPTAERAAIPTGPAIDWAKVGVS